MQSVGLQTVLQMSNVGERVHQTALTHGAVVADQFKDMLEKQNATRKIEVHESNQSGDIVQIRGEEERKGKQQQPEGQKREAQGQAEVAEEQVEPAPARALPVDAAPQGRLLNIKV